MTFGNMFTVVEVGAVIIVLWELLWGLKRGLAPELFRLIGTTAGLVAGLRFYQTVGRLLVENTRLSEDPELAQAVAFLLIVVCVALLFLVARLILRLLMTVKFNDKIDRSGGGFAGLLRGVMMALLCVFAVGLWPHEDLRDVVRKQSIVGRAVFQYAPPVIGKLKAIRWLDISVKTPALTPEVHKFEELVPPLPEGK